MKVSIVSCLIFFLIVLNLFSQDTSTLENLQAEISQLIHATRHSVVTVSAKSTLSYMINKDEGLLSLFKNNHEEKKDCFWTIGSGVIYNQDGYIITRSSILADFEEIKVTLCDGSEFEADYIGTDDITRLAILKIDAPNLKPPLIGNSDQLGLYSFVMLLGNSLGLSSFASFGLVNGLTKDGRFILSAAINPGNIGGAVFNLKGELVGIITAQVEAEISMIGPNYLDYSQQSSIAIPINRVVELVNGVIKFHHQQTHWLGIELDNDSNKLIVIEVRKDSPAARVGLRPGDQLVKYNEVDLTSPEILKRQIGLTELGSSVSINFIRHNRPMKVFPRIERMWPPDFDPNKPQHYNPNMLNENNKAPIQSPILMSPQRFQQINSKMIQMEGEIRSLKSKINK